AGMEVSSSDQSNPGMSRGVVSGEAIQVKIKASPGEDSIIARASRDAAIEAKDKRAKDRDDARSQQRGPGVQRRRPDPPSSPCIPVRIRRIRTGMAAFSPR